MVLILFDVDGTLTESLALDASVFLDTVRKTFGFRDISEDWASYQHVTGAGVLREIVETRLGRPPTAEEIVRVKTRLEAALRAGIEQAGGLKPVPGAAEILARLIGSPSAYAVALASGNWKAVAGLMLASAGLPTKGLPGAFSDDAVTREDICRVARQRAEARAGREFERVVYVGDGVWDVRSAQALGYGFVGIGRGAAAVNLRAAGAEEVLPDFQDAEAFLAAGERAATSPLASSRSVGTAASAH